jgi:hypothetical protein
MTLAQASWAAEDTSGRGVAEPAHKERRDRVGQRPAQDAEHAGHGRAIGAERRRPDQDADPGDPEQHASKPGAVQRLAGKQAEHDQREEGRGGVEHGGEAAGNAGLAVDHQRERNDVVDRRQGHERRPSSRRRRHAMAEGIDQRHERQRGDGDTREHEGERRHLRQGHRNEEEGRAPEHGEEHEQEPVGGAHRFRCQVPGARNRVSGPSP